MYDIYKQFYTNLEINYGNSTLEEKQILKILMYESTIKESILVLSKNISISLADTSDVWELCLIVANYCSIA